MVIWMALLKICFFFHPHHMFWSCSPLANYCGSTCIHKDIECIQEAGKKNPWGTKAEKKTICLQSAAAFLFISYNIYITHIYLYFHYHPKINPFYSCFYPVPASPKGFYTERIYLVMWGQDKSSSQHIWCCRGKGRVFCFVFLHSFPSLS